MRFLPLKEAAARFGVAMGIHTLGATREAAQKTQFARVKY